MKKRTILILAFVLTITLIAPSSFAEAQDEASILVIEHGVTEIEEGQYKNRKDITSVVIPDTVVSIGDEAFSECRSLVSVTIPDSVVSIGDEAFARCYKLTDVVIPSSVRQIGEGAFEYCGSLVSIYLPDSVETIGEEAFWNCSRLESVHLPEGLTVIGDLMFNGCDSLTEVNIPETVTRIESWAFAACTSLREISIPAGVTYFGDGAFGGTVFDEDRDLFIPQSFFGVEPLEGNWEHLLRGRKVTARDMENLDGILFSLLPEDSRTIDTREAEYALVRYDHYSPRNDYTGPANDAITEVYLVSRNGDISRVCRICHAPPKSGVVKQGSSLNGSVATTEEIWEAIKDLF